MSNVVSTNKADFDDFPIYDEIIKHNSDKLSTVWRDFFATFKETLSTYLTSGGIFLPQLTTTQRDALQNVSNGQMIYNITDNTAQYFKNGVWTNF